MILERVLAEPHRIIEGHFGVGSGIARAYKIQLRARELSLSRIDIDLGLQFSLGHQPRFVQVLLALFYRLFVHLDACPGRKHVEITLAHLEDQIQALEIVAGFGGFGLVLPLMNQTAHAAQSNRYWRIDRPVR